MALRCTTQQAEVLALGDGKLRVTKQLAEVLAAGDGKLRVTGQVVEVLTSATAALEVYATDTLSLTDVATGGKLYLVDTTHSVSLTDAACAEIVRFISDTLVLMDTAACEMVRSLLVADALSLGDEAEVAADWERASTDNLELSDGLVLAATARVNGLDTLEIVDQATGDVIKAVQHTLTLTHAATLDVIRRSSDDLSLSDEAVVSMVYALPVAEAMSLADQAGVQVDWARSAEDTLALTDAAVGDYCRVVTDTLSVTDEATNELIKPVIDALDLTEEFGAEWVYNRRRIDTLALTHQAVASFARAGSASSTLALTHSATVSLVRTAADTLTLTDVAAVDQLRLASDTLTLTDTAVVTTNRVGAQDDLLDLSHTATVGFVRYRLASDRISLHDTARPGVVFAAASDALQELHYSYDPVTGEYTPYYTGLQDRADAALVPYAPTPVADTLTLWDQAFGVAIHADAQPGDVTDTLVLTQSATVEQWPIVRDAIHAADSLVLAHAAVVALVRPAVDTLDLTDEATVVTWRATLAVTDTLQLGHSVAFVRVTGGSLYQYCPFVGEGSAGAPVPPSSTLDGPMPGIEVPFQLVYPAVGAVSDSVTLRAPEFGNKDRLQFNRISRETRGGTLIVFADPMWPKVETMALTFSGLLQSQALALLAFMEAHLGEEIGLIDWEHRYWRGVIVNPIDPVVQDGKNRFTASFEFEGELDPTWNPQVIPPPIYSIPGQTPKQPYANYPVYLPAEMDVDDYYTAEVDVEVAIGTPIYLTTAAHARPAQANGVPQAQVAGFSTTVTQPGFACKYVTEGLIARDDWTVIAGTTALMPGSVYFLDPDASGRITAIPPSASGHYVVRIGRAVSALNLDLEIETPIRL